MISARSDWFLQARNAMGTEFAMVVALVWNVSMTVIAMGQIRHARPTNVSRVVMARKTGRKRVSIAEDPNVRLAAAWRACRATIAQWACIASTVFVVTHPARSNAKHAI